MWLLKSIFGIAVAVGASAGAANAGSYTYTTIDVPVSNTPYSEAIGISNNGQIVGMGVVRAFLIRRGLLHILDTSDSILVSSIIKDKLPDNRAAECIYHITGRYHILMAGG